MTFEWYETAMVFRVFIFIFSLTTVRENKWMRTTVLYFSKVPFKKYLIAAMFEVSTVDLHKGV